MPQLTSALAPASIKRERRARGRRAADAADGQQRAVAERREPAAACSRAQGARLRSERRDDARHGQ